MRLWSLHPRYLDARGLVACWREGLLARKVLKGETRGYRNHPQLERFKLQPDPIDALDGYLLGLLDEADRRGYSFSRDKIGPTFAAGKIAVTDGQLEFEWRHLMNKLQVRDVERYGALAKAGPPLPHPIFDVRRGGIESWERGADR